MKAAWIILLLFLGAFPVVLHFSRGGTREEGNRKSALKVIADATPRGFKLIACLAYLALVFFVVAKAKGDL